MRNSSFLKWTQNKNSLKSNNRNGDNKNWIHPPENLVQGQVVYLVKFLGSTEVDQAKGIEVVKQGIQKLKFAQQLRRSESSNGNWSTKTPKVELSISADCVIIQDPKSKRLMHEYALHKISYCADDKAEKRFFSFIAKEKEGKHTCFVFVSDKLAEEITLTIGQAFELAYKKFLETSGKEMEEKKQMMTMQKRIQILEEENKTLKQRLTDLHKALDNSKELKAFLTRHKLKHLDEVASSISASSEMNKELNKEIGKEKCEDELICLDSLVIVDENNKLDNLSLDDLNDDDFDPRASTEESKVLLMPPPKHKSRMKSSASEPGHMNNPFKKDDPFGMENFHHAATNLDFKTIDNFNLNDLDPLAKI